MLDSKGGYCLYLLHWNELRIGCCVGEEMKGILYVSDMDGEGV
jgi:hypothetical protein